MNIGSVNISVNSNLYLLYKLSQDQEFYWILYDLCLENNWAFIDNAYINWYLIGHGAYANLVDKSLAANEYGSCMDVKLCSLSAFIDRSQSRGLSYSY
jgi:hypothetical protein